MYLNSMLEKFLLSNFKNFLIKFLENINLVLKSYILEKNNYFFTKRKIIISIYDHIFIDVSRR